MLQYGSLNYAFSITKRHNSDRTRYIIADACYWLADNGKGPKCPITLSGADLDERVAAN